MGKNKVMAHALGADESSEVCSGVHILSPYIVGKDVGLLFTNRNQQSVVDFFSQFAEANFARSGFVSNRTFVVSKGVLDVSFAMEPHLRDLGMNVTLRDAKVELVKDCVVCSEGDVLTPKQCKLLELFDMQLAVMRIVLRCHLDLENLEFQEFAMNEDDGESSNEIGKNVPATSASFEGNAGAN
uniref:Large ribosomal subunit protein uL10-like insertion domain-containing protein n=1 Tax=Lygus hesperus TaxID=30085 RepID=A0A0A9XK96_LYGHE